MATLDNSYSRLVTWLKILLPLTALAILSSLFLVSRTTAPSLIQPTTDGASPQTPHEAQISFPSLSGVTQNGAAYTLGAKSAAPLSTDPDILGVVNFVGSISETSGLKINLSAPRGSINSIAGTASLSQGVKIITSEGYDIQTQELQVDIQRSELRSAGPITAISPLGHMSAGQMVLQQQSQDGSNASYELVFKNGVKLLYLPGK